MGDGDQIDLKISLIGRRDQAGCSPEFALTKGVPSYCVCVCVCECEMDMV